jgi:dUTPase
MFTLEIVCNDDSLKALYEKRVNHADDSGVDLFVPEDTWVKCGETVFLSHQIRCRMIRNSTGETVPFCLYPRSSISKTPLILANHVGVIDKNNRGEIIAALKYLPHLFELQTIVQNVHAHIQGNMVSIIQSCPTLDRYDACDRIQNLEDFDTNQALSELQYCIKKHSRLVQICAPDLSPVEIKIVDKLDET